MRDRPVGIKRAHAGQGEFDPAGAAAVIALPVERAGSLQALHPIPSFGQPMARLLIAARSDKTGIFAIGDETRGQFVGLQIDPMARFLVVEAKRAVGRRADLHHPFGV